MSVLELKDLCYQYDKNTVVLNNANFTFDTGKVYAVVGKSGAGKTTLLSLLAGLTKPTGGRIIYQDKDISKTNRYKYRSTNVGVVFQSFNLLPKLTAAENVVLSMDVSGKKIVNKKAAAAKLLENVGLEPHEAKRRILKLSGGQQQRVAIARALSYDPAVILADEPTGNLDGDTADQIMDIFLRLAHEENRCVIIVTHSPEVSNRADVVYELQSLRAQSKAQPKAQVAANA